MKQESQRAFYSTCFVCDTLCLTFCSSRKQFPCGDVLTFEMFVHRLTQFRMSAKCNVRVNENYILVPGRVLYNSASHV